MSFLSYCVRVTKYFTDTSFNLTVCSRGWFGYNCNSQCSEHCEGGIEECDRYNGTCFGGSIMMFWNLTEYSRVLCNCFPWQQTNVERNTEHVNKRMKRTENVFTADWVLFINSPESFKILIVNDTLMFVCF